MVGIMTPSPPRRAGSERSYHSMEPNAGWPVIGIGETSRRLIAKAILAVLRQDILNTSGCLQLCAGQHGGCEVAVHAMKELFDDAESEGTLLVNASNAFNSLNRRSALLNMFELRLSFATILTNIYRMASNLFIDGTSLLSREGTTQGDPLAMPMYAISLIPVIQHLRGMAKQVWYADDAAAGGRICQLKNWWDKLCSVGRPFGYNVNATKSWLVVKEGSLQSAWRVFAGTGVQITSVGCPYLGAALGSISFINDYTQQRVSEWIAGVSHLSLFANTQPHASYSAFTHGYVSKWNYYFRTNSGISALLSPLESAVRNHLLPKLVPHAVSDTEWELFSFPVRFGGFGICNPVSISEEQYGFSRALLRGFVDLVLSQFLSQKSALCPEVIHHQNDLFRHRLPSCNQPSLIVPHLCAGLLSAAWRGGPLPGYLHFHWSSMVSPFIKVNSLMPSVYVMALHHHCYHRTVCVVRILPCLTPLAAHMVPFQLSGC